MESTVLENLDVFENCVEVVKNCIQQKKKKNGLGANKPCVGEGGLN